MPASEHPLGALADPTGVFCTLALDHRDAMRNAFRQAGVLAVTAETMLEVKCRIATVLAPQASAILLDPETARTCRPAGLGLLVPLEEQGHEQLAGGRLNRLLDDFGPREAAGLGADGCKLLLYFRADHKPTAVRQRELVTRAAEQCHRLGVPLVLEPLVYRLEGEDEDAYRDAFADLVIAGAGALTDSGANLLKLQFPAGADEPAACRRLTEAASPLPWALLGGNEVDGLTFARQVEIACRSGASGFIAGRAIWGGALALAATEQEGWLTREGLPLFRSLATIARNHGRPCATP